MLTAEEAQALRSAVESEHNGNRDDIEKQYVADRNALEAQYHEDIEANARTKRAAYITAGLNPDGSDPQGRQQGS
jgi:hypothetical protein